MHFTVEAQNRIAHVLSEGSIAIDATAGNGFDTLFLAHRVGASGRVYAVDIQRDAIANVERKLSEQNMLQRCILTVSSHDRMPEWMHSEDIGKVSAAMMNLGYLPFGDKSIVTLAQTTLRALDHLYRSLRPEGILSVLAYRGHAGGEEESASVADWMESRRPNHSLQKFVDLDNPKSPVLWLLEKPAL